MAELTIERLGRQGDGIAFENGQEVFVPFSLPGETLRVADTGKRRTIAELQVASPERTEPPCPHFGICGGCQMQHMRDETYRAWKQELVREQLEKAGIECAVEPMLSFPIASRRKAVFNACRLDSNLQFGFAERASNRIVDIETCLVLDPALAEGLANIREIAASLPLGKKPVRISVLVAQNGLDIALEDAPRLSPAQRNALGQKTLDLGFLRIAIDGDVLIERERPMLAMGNAMVTPPPGSFVQAVGEAEAAMAELVGEHLKPCKNVADLFCGIGTFALRLAERATVLAVEENAAAIEALDRAWRETGGKLKQIKCETRNLDRRPLAFTEMKKIGGLVFDPPREGAEMQAKQIAKSKVKRVAAVSCNPSTLARDLKMLVDGGYKITRIVPLDQFRFTPHVEVVALLER